MFMEEEWKKKKQKSFWLGVIAGVCVVSAIVLGCAIGGFLWFKDNSSKEFLGKKESTKLRVIQAMISRYYYKDVTEEDMADGLYKGLVASTDDPYSQYFTPKEYEQLKEETSGNYAGIGALLGRPTGTTNTLVTKVYDNSPAQEAGLKKNDEIVSADGYRSEHFETLSDFVNHIRGEESSDVTIVYKRAGKEKSVIIKRKNIEIPSVLYYMLDQKKGIGYIEIMEFTGNTQKEFEHALADLKRQGLKAVVYDVRMNPGGLVDQVTGILDDLLPKGTTVSMKDKKGREVTYSSDDRTQEKIPCVVLTSGQSASAAEIFAGAIRDFKYGTLIGTKTFGKGIVQQTMPLSDGSAVKLTTETYYTPSGDCIHKKGIKPDLELQYKFKGDKERADLSVDTYDYKNDNQIQKGMEVLKKELSR
jgi:carboxyl-terminal processing protease